MADGQYHQRVGPRRALERFWQYLHPVCGPVLFEGNQFRREHVFDQPWHKGKSNSGSGYLPSNRYFYASISDQQRMMIKKLKSLFVVDDGKPAENQEETTESTDISSTSTGSGYSQTQATQTPSYDLSGGKPQSKLLDVLFTALQNSNQPGFDYMEFRDFLKSLSNVPMDDATRVKSAYATAQTMGATKAAILQSAEFYLSVLKKEEDKFQDALKERENRDLTGKQNQIKDLEKAIKDKEAQIESLKAEMETNRKTITDVEGEINTAASRIQQTASDFHASYDNVVKQIQSDIQLIQQNL